MILKEIQLNITLPERGIGIVMMQPFVQLDISQEPYCWAGDKKNEQIQRIVRTLEIAHQADHGCEKTNLILFPEYSIPGLEGIQKIQEVLNSDSLKKGTIIIGGVDGLTKDEYANLCGGTSTSVQEKNKPDEVGQEQWINCCVVLAKDADGIVKRWIQPKIIPSWPEKAIVCNDMFCGKSVYLFRCKFENEIDCYFLVLICFDWIGQIGSNDGVWAVLSEVNNYWKSSGRKDVHFIFLLQNNDEPNHRDFLENARNYFENRGICPFTARDNSVIFFVNTAEGDKPGKYQKYGYSSVICSPNAPYDANGCPPTFALKTTKLRNTDNLGRCKEALFREMGACIHSFAFNTPSFINVGPTGRSFIIDKANIHPVDERTDDPRVPSKPVAASVKWVNDQLDDIKSVLHHEGGNPLRGEIEQKYEEVSKAIRQCNDSSIVKCLEQALCTYNKWIHIGERKVHDVDDWDEREKTGLEKLIHSLSIIKTCKPLEVFNTVAHGTMKKEANVIDVIVISDGETHEVCFEHAKKHYLGSEQRFVIVVTDDGKSSLPIRGSIMAVEYDRSHGPYIPDPESRFTHCGYRNLIDACFHSRTIRELDRKISKIIGW